MTTPRKRQPRKAAAAPSSQRERLLGRPRPSLPYRILIDAAMAERARAELAEAQKAARQVLLRDGPDSEAYQTAQETAAAAEQAVDVCYETLTLRALPPARVAELEAEHPPTPQQMDQVKAEREQAHQRGEPQPDWPSWNDDTFYPALLAESVDGDMTTADWAAFLADNVSTGEATGLKTAALDVNRLERIADPLVLPKGWTPIIS